MTTTQTTPKKTTRRVKTTPAQKAAPKAKAAPKKENAPKKAEAPKVNVHREAGVDTTTYAGLSPFLNANRKVAVKLVGQRSEGDMTERLQKSLYAMRKTYGNRQFPAKGWDNGVLRDLIATGLIAHKGGQETTIDGKPALIDGAQPLVLSVTTKGQNYGKTS